MNSRDLSCFSMLLHCSGDAMNEYIVILRIFSCFSDTNCDDSYCGSRSFVLCCLPIWSDWSKESDGRICFTFYDCCNFGTPCVMILKDIILLLNSHLLKTDILSKVVTVRAYRKKVVKIKFHSKKDFSSFLTCLFLYTTYLWKLLFY